MKVELLHHTPLHICSDAIRTCWNSFDKSDAITEEISCLYPVGDGPGIIERREAFKKCGPKDKELIDRVGNKYKHASTLEHLHYNFYVKGISRALLQELARHRIASLSVKSTRYTLKELKKETLDSPIQLLDKYCVMTGNEIVDMYSLDALANVRNLLLDGVSNDKAKYCLPESFKTELTWSINARSLQNFLSLRSDKAALWEIRNLAVAVFDALPEDHKYLFKGCMKGETDEQPN